MPKKIKKVAVLGAGVMGAQIAGHLGNAGIPSYLFDINKELAEKGKNSLSTLKPAPLYQPQNIDMVTSCTYDDDLEKIAEADWVLEAVVERLDIKELIYQKLLPHLKPEMVQQRQQFAVQITGFQMGMSRILMEIIFGGVLEKYQNLYVVIGESGIGWIPYVLDHMDLEWEDQFRDLTLTMKPSEYWYRQCRATYQSDKVGIKLLDVLGEDNIMWGSDFPHPDGVWPDSQDFIDSELEGVTEAQKQKIICDNAAKLYGFAPA